MQDPDVPWSHALQLVAMLGPDTELTLVKSGEHRLSAPRHLALILRLLSDLASKAA